MYFEERRNSDSIAFSMFHALGFKRIRFHRSPPSLPFPEQLNEKDLDAWPIMALKEWRAH